MAEIWTVQSLRAFEENIREIYLTGVCRGAIHLRRGGEHQLIEIFKDIHPQDWCFGSYRSHLHALLKGIPREEVKATILAGKSMHLEFPAYRFFTSAIVAGHIPIALGVALGIKRRGGPEKVWVFCGDMASETGTFHEAVKYAQGFDLPITFVIECNGLSTNSPTHQVWGMPHAHVTTGKSVLPQHFDPWEKGGVIRYCYDREGWPHYGVGLRVDFDQVDEERVMERSDVMA